MFTNPVRAKAVRSLGFLRTLIFQLGFNFVQREGNIVQVFEKGFDQRVILRLNFT